MKPADNIGVTFVSTVLGRGVVNSVVNLTFGTYAFDPTDDGKEIETVPYVSARLRMDIPAARALHAELSALLQALDQPVSVPNNDAAEADGKPLN